MARRSYEKSVFIEGQGGAELVVGAHHVGSQLDAYGPTVGTCRRLHDSHARVGPGSTDHGNGHAIVTGKQPIFFVINGHDVMMVLEDNVSLPKFLRQRQRLLAEEGKVVVSFGDLWKGSRR